MATPVKVRRLSDEEGRQLQRIVRRGGGGTDKSIVKWRRALVVLASAGGNDVVAIARLVQTSPDRVREMIHSFNDKGLRALDPQWAGGRPRRITTEERQLIVKTATKRPRSLGQPFTRWSVRKLAQYLATKRGKRVRISRERLRQILADGCPFRSSARTFFLREQGRMVQEQRRRLSTASNMTWPSMYRCSCGVLMDDRPNVNLPSLPRQLNMRAHRHRRQRRVHLYRYGFLHWRRHMRHERHSHPVKMRKPRRRSLMWILGGAATIVLIAICALGVLSYRSLNDARNSLNRARATISAALNNRHQLASSRGRTNAKRQIAAVQRDAQAADATLRSSFALSVLGNLPIVGSQVQGVMSLTNDIRQTTSIGNNLLGQVNTLAATSNGATVSLPQLARLQASVSSAQKALTSFNRPSRGLWGPLVSAARHLRH